MLFVVGTGRSGTYSIATAFEQMGYQSHHERWAFITVQASHWYSTGRLSPDEADLLLRQVEWGQVEVDANLSLLVPILADAVPEARFLWVRRDRQKTVESMVRHGWYRDGDDYAPDLYYAGFRRFTNSVSLFMNLNHAGHRVKGWQVSDVPVEEWRAAEPFVRCRWYVNWLSNYLEQNLPEERSEIIDIETVTVDDLHQIATWVFPDQNPERLVEVPNVRIEDPIDKGWAVQPNPREKTLYHGETP